MRGLFLSEKSFTNKKATVRSSCPEVFLKQVFLEVSKNSQENTCVRVFILKKNDSGTGVFQ